MSKTTGKNGRFGNQLIRNIMLSKIAKKHNLYSVYYNHDLINQLGIDLYCGENKYDVTKELTDDNYFKIFERDKIDFNLDPNKSFFQTKELTNFLYKSIIDLDNMYKIIQKNPFKNRYNNNNDIFIHLRIHGVSGYNPGAKYYIKIIESLEFDNIYFSSDVKNHPILLEFIDYFKDTGKLHWKKYERIKTIQFGSTCKNIILSHGSFQFLNYFLQLMLTTFSFYKSNINLYFICPWGSILLSDVSDHISFYFFFSIILVLYYGNEELLL